MRGARRGPFGDLPPEVAILTAVSFTVALGFGIVAPAIPAFARQFGVSVAAAASVISVFALMRIVGALPAGRLVDRFGEPGVMAAGLAVVAVSSVMAGCSGSFGELMVLRGSGGVGSAMFSISAQALLLGSVPSHQRGRASGLFSGGFLLGGISGPAVGGLVAAWSLRAPFFIYGGLLVVPAILAAVVLRRTPNHRPPSAARPPPRPAATLRWALRSRTYRAAAAANLADGFAALGVRGALVPLFVREVLDRSAVWTGIGFLLFAALNGAALVPGGRMADTVGRRPVVIVGCVISASGMLMLALLPGPCAYLAALAVAGFGSGLLDVAPAAMIGDIIGRGGGILVASYQMAGDIGSVVGPVAGGLLVDSASYGAAFGLAAAVLCGAAVLGFLSRETRPARRPATLPSALGLTRCVSASGGGMTDQEGPPLRFGVLGPLRAWRGDDAVELGPVQQRVVLAVLCLQAGRPVGRDQMIDAVWGPLPPRNAVNLVQRHVSGLRQVLEPGRPGHTPSGLLAWTDAGYLLNVPAGGLDLHVFEGDVRRARAAQAAGQLRDAAQALHAALDLWRGPVCGGLSSPYLDAQRERLAESRISVTEERIELDLAIGSPPDVIAELRDLIAEHPLRERLRGLLMLALYRADRQADALAAFRDARSYLNDELGVDPSAALQKLHQQILAGAPELAAVPAGAAPDMPASISPRRPVPAQLPHRIPDFTGRDAELAELDAVLARDRNKAGDTVVIAAITGTAGVGKSALAVHWAYQVRDQFPDGQLYVNLRGFGPSGSAMDPAEAIHGFLDAFAVLTERIPTDLDGRAALYRSLLADLRVLIVLDNARDVDQVRPLLPGSPGSLVVVTSRNQLLSLVAADGARPVALDLLSAGEARDLLGRRLGPARVAGDPVPVDEIIEACAGLPLALAVAAAHAAANPRLPLSALADALRRTHGRLDTLDGGDQYTDVRAVFSWSYQALGEPEARMFRLLGLHAGPDIATQAAASMAGVPLAQARRQLADLVRAHLLTEWAPGRFVLHDLLRAYASELCADYDGEAERRLAVHRVLDHYLHTAYAADQLLHPRRDDSITLAPPQPPVTPEPLADYLSALTWFGTERQVLLAVLRQAVSYGFDVHAWQLAWAVNTYFDRHGHWYDAAASHRIALEAAQRLGDQYAQAVIQCCLACAYCRLGGHVAADRHLRQALELYEGLGDHAGKAHAHMLLNWVFDRQSRYQEGLGHAEQAVGLFRFSGRPAGQARALNAVGWFHIQLGDHETGLARCLEALDMQKKIADRLGQADTLDSIAVAHRSMGRYDEAIGYYRQALQLYVEFGDRYYEAQTLVYLGDTNLAAGRPESAVTFWQDAVTIFDDLGLPEAASLRAKLGNVARRPGGAIAGDCNHVASAT